jgi:hypothetical protein
MLTEHALNIIVTIILAVEALLLVVCIPALLYVGQQVDRIQTEKAVWIQQIRRLREQLNMAKKDISGINFTTKTVLPAALASGPWKIILPVLLRLI